MDYAILYAMSIPASEPMAVDVKIGLRSLAFAALILLSLMTMTGGLTRIIPPGSYERVLSQGVETVIPGSFTYGEPVRTAFWRWYTAPIEVLWGPDAVTIISIIIFMCLIAGSINILNTGGILSYVITSIARRFNEQRYRMEALIILIFMLFGSILGSMEEVVVLVPLIAALARSMGWDSLTGLGLSLGAIAFGFASAISNPFTVGVAQKIAGVPLFSGAPYRIIIGIAIYLVYTAFVIYHSKHTTSPTLQEVITADSSVQQKDPSMDRAVIWFTSMISVMIVMIILSSMIPPMSSMVLPLVMIFFLLGGAGSGWVSGMHLKELASSFMTGITNVAAGSILVLMAASIKHIMATAGIMDTILYRASDAIAASGPYRAVILLYLLVLILNFFISSGSAKAFLIMPIIAPLADLVGLSRQTAILAFVFGDGFSNILYPTNALLLICLSITGVSYRAWFRWIWKIEAVIFLMTAGFLLIAVSIGY
jgi:uncharacterized ion transporter superfamily protein YfcC